MKNQEIHLFSTYQEVLDFKGWPVLISIREPNPSSIALTDFLNTYKYTSCWRLPPILLAYDLHDIHTLQALVNSFHFLRIVPIHWSEEKLKTLSLQTLDHFHEKQIPPPPSTIFPHLGESSQATTHLQSTQIPQREITPGHMAHEINNPLGGMISFIKLIKMESFPTKPHHSDILKMEKNGQECKRIVEDLL